MVDFLDPSVQTIAKLLKANGYATAHFGKWHMGGEEYDRYFHQRQRSDGLAALLQRRFLPPGWTGPFYGWKWCLCEGGIRMPFIIRWPARIKAGETNDLKEAAKWYRLTAEQGDAYPQFELGQMYESGEGLALANGMLLKNPNLIKKEKDS